jgi:AAA family ATP:ADP antiporter
LLGLRYSGDDILTIYKGLTSKQRDLRINGLEFLDNLLHPGLKKTLIPLVETAMLETISEEAIKNLNLGTPDEYECFGMLLRGRDLRIKIAVLYLITQLKNPRYLPLVQEFTYSDDKKIRSFARMAEGVLI